MIAAYKHKQFILSFDGKIHSSYADLDEARRELVYIKKAHPKVREFTITDSHSGKEAYWCKA